MMGRCYVLYNPLSASGNGAAEAKKLAEMWKEKKPELMDITKIQHYRDFMSSLEADDVVALCGGDGTLNRFVNDLGDLEVKNEVYYFATGTGNDFLHDLGKTKEDGPVLINEYIKDLPIVTVKGQSYRFINGVGYGIDGYCCEVGDKMREKSDKPVNYTSIAIKGLLFHYKTTSADITVDGVKKHYDKVWLAPTMHGRFYGGGMNATPDQKRLDPEHKLSTLLFHGSGKLKTLMIFPGIFKGEHVKHTDCVEVLTGHDVIVEFDKPTALQIDGETFLGVTSYHMVSKK